MFTTFHPSREPSSAQDVEVRFVPEGTGTRLELVATKWENWGKDAAKARKGYHLGWGYVLKVWAGRRDAGMVLLDGLAAAPGRRCRSSRAGGCRARQAGGEIARGA